MNIVLSCRYETEGTHKHIMVSACSIAVLYLLVLLKSGEYSPGAFLFYFLDAVLIILAF